MGQNKQHIQEEEKPAPPQATTVQADSIDRTISISVQESAETLAPTAEVDDSNDPSLRTIVVADATEAGSLVDSQAPTKQARETSLNASATPFRSTLGEDEVIDDWDHLPPPVFEEGRVVFGKYRLLEKIGVGGMGEVWRVLHLGLDSERALKVIRAEFAQNDKGWRRFRREARLMAKIDHPNAVAVYDFKRAHSMGYIEMELVRGRSLSQILKEENNQPMALERVRAILDPLCDVLQAAHEHVDEQTGKPKPILHRDLKPSNLMLIEARNAGEPPRLKVLDFGIAKMVDEDAAVDLTGAGDLVGTPAYMSPEQIRGGYEKEGVVHPVDPRSDLYSVGVVLYHLLTGCAPFQGNKMAVLAAHLNTRPRPLREANPAASIPPEVEELVLRCLEKDPALRPASAQELKELFAQAVGPATPIKSAPEIKAASPRRPLVLAAAALILSAGGLALYALAPKNPAPSANSPAAAATANPDLTRPAAKTSPSLTRALWAPEGYQPVNPYQPDPENPSLPRELTRQRDGAVFHHWKHKLYLPAGYAPDPATSEQTVGPWPKVIVRQSDGTRFIRLAGGVFKIGDPRDATIMPDFYGNACTPHYVRISGFYIQESEVTNSELDDYLRNRHPEDGVFLADWRRIYEQSVRELGKQVADRLPAVAVDARVARRYALSVGGLLPLEAEWEYAAKSTIESYWFAWGKTITPQSGPPRARLMSIQDDDRVGPAQVMTYPGDRTEQNVFDMVGNVREICADVYAPYSARNPAAHASPEQALELDRSRLEPGPSDGEAKVIVRGGSFKIQESQAFAFYRWAERVSAIPDDVGFRVVLECPEPDPPGSER